VANDFSKSLTDDNTRNYAYSLLFIEIHCNIEEEKLLVEKPILRIFAEISAKMVFYRGVSRENGSKSHRIAKQNS